MLRKDHLKALVVISIVAVASAGACSSNTGTGSGGSGAGNSSGTSEVTGSGGNASGTGSTGSMQTSTGSSGACIPDCAAGSLCQQGTCVPGCDPAHGCNAGKSCCSGSCVDTATDPAHCGACDGACAMPAHIAVGCNGNCTFGACDSAFFDCDGNKDNGCESQSACSCTPGATQACYDGAMGTQGVGPCVGGMQTCNATGTGWGPCGGEVLPITELCANNVDDDCDGNVDNVPDLDGDGWTTCNGDCCDVAGGTCSNPALVNPGAFEVGGNMVDDDCDGTVDNTLGTCSSASKFTGVTATDVANAIDLCQTTTANAPLPTKKWGVLSAQLLLANGAVPAGADLTNIQNFQTAVLTDFGTGGVVPKFGTTMAGLSSGRMRDAGDTGFVKPVVGTAFASAIAFNPLPGAPLGTYLANHSNNLLPGQCGGTPCDVGTGANDSVNARIQIRVPTNALSMHYDFRFFSGEYQGFQCTAYNDYYLAMLQTGAAMIPADHNISFDANNNAVSVNNGFFQDCGGNAKNCAACPGGTGALVGTGMDQVNGGATEWLTTDAPVVPGETMTIEFVIFDVTDHIYDSLVLLDNFRWSVMSSTVGTHT